ncbi:hypothetical protein CABS01_04799 [Colletotrichum abscissum]|uniref:uncharacterized protein n=1 Tax=Colletotrichum abscissum TaxID=1671311 RepID=UPI0027D50D19|nr:uncharacterized protein CABS01_04799 [Colletotrichum abscissum]KAK1472156.1 hypothetical protein CABS01_04799 [Colletotrichum abscissum]
MSPALKRPHAIQYTGAGFFSQKGGHLGGRHQRVIGLIWQSPGLVSPGRPPALRTYAIPKVPLGRSPKFPRVFGGRVRSGVPRRCQVDVPAQLLVRFLAPI